MPAPNAPKKRTCKICDTEHNVGEACPECNWHQEKEEAMVKADLERKRMRDEAAKPEKKERPGWF